MLLAQASRVQELYCSRGSDRRTKHFKCNSVVAHPKLFRGVNRDILALVDSDPNHLELEGTDLSFDMDFTFFALLGFKIYMAKGFCFQRKELFSVWVP